jgi:hypothetical protein
MNMPPLQIGEVLLKLLGHAIQGPKDLCRAVVVATCSVTENLLWLLTGQVVQDLGRVKEAMLGKMEAEAEETAANARRALAEAAEAANRANIAIGHHAVARAQRRQFEANAAKTEAEAEAIRKEAETHRLQAIAEAQIRFLEAVSSLRQAAGDIGFSQENLEEILRLLRLSLEQLPSDKGIDV